MKRVLDIVVSFFGLLVFLPFLFVIGLLIYCYDFHSPFYIAPRVGQYGYMFKMVKFRSMVVNADKTGVTSTSSADRRITPVGKFVRQYKVDEIVQLWNVLKGDMSLVGPRPNVKSDTDLYTTEEKKLLNIKPGVTDFASIVFADEGDILRGHENPNLAYDQLIRPWKSRLGLFYCEHRTVALDVKLIFLTALTIASRRRALQSISRLLSRLGATPELVRISERNEQLLPGSPP